MKMQRQKNPKSSPLLRHRSPVDTDRARTMSEVTSGSARGSRSSAVAPRLKSATSGTDRTSRNSSRPNSSVSVQQKNSKRITSSKGAKGLKKTHSQSEDNQDLKEADVIKPEEKLLNCLVTCLAEVSRQRLRAFHMSLRHCGNVDNRVTVKDMQAALQESQITISQRAWALISELYETPTGLDYESLYQCLSAAHLKTGRDSIKARSQRNDIEAREVWSREAVDNDFVRRLEELLIKDNTFFDIPLLKEECSKWDHKRIGKMDREGAQLIFSDKTPLYGALLKNLLERCDEDKDKKISWPLLLNFMEKAQSQAWTKHPEMAQLPGKAKEVAALRIATPDPLDELSSSTRSAMSKLLKRAQMRRAPSTDTSPDPPLSRESTLANVKATKPTNEKKEDGQVAGTSGQDGSKETSDKAAAEAKCDVVSRGKQSSDSTTEGSQGTENADKKTKHKLIPGSDVTIAVPPDFKPTDSTIDPPRERLQLEWIYGYRGKDCQRNLNVLASGQLIYFLSNVVVLLNTDEVDHTQGHYREHTQAIRCLAVHSNGLIVATGQTSGKAPSKDRAHVRVWRSDTLQTLHVLGEGVFVKTVTCLTFMPGEDLLATTDNSLDKKLTLWNVQSGNTIAETFVSTEVLCDMTFNPKYPEILVTSGKEHLCWWKVSKDARLVQPSAQPKYDLFLKARFIYCQTHTSKGDLVTGDSNGTIYVWGDGGNTITNFIKHGHDGPVLSLCHFKSHLMTGGRDGCVRTWNWNKNMDLVACLQLSSIEGGIRTLRVIPSSGSSDLHPTLILGTTMQGLFTGELGTDSFEGLTCITQGHGDELSGLRTLTQSPIGADIVTASCDGVICKLNTQSRDVIWRAVFKGYSFTCVDATHDGLQMALGTRDGHLVLIHIDDFDLTPVVVFNKKVTSSPLNSVKMAPDMRMVAMAGQDRTVHIFSLQRKEENQGGRNGGEEDDDDNEEDWKLHGRCRGHHGPVLDVDWSSQMRDGAYLLKSCSSKPEQMFWNSQTCRPVDGDLVCSDVAWNSHSCMLDHSLIGLWNSNQAKENHVIGGDVSAMLSLVAMTTDDGSLSLFRYPCCSTAAFSHTYKAHQRTERLCFTRDGRSLMTVGGTDMSIMQWKLV